MEGEVGGRLGKKWEDKGGNTGRAELGGDIVF